MLSVWPSTVTRWICLTNLTWPRRNENWFTYSELCTISNRLMQWLLTKFNIMISILKYQTRQSAELRLHAYMPDESIIMHYAWSLIYWLTATVMLYTCTFIYHVNCTWHNITVSRNVTNWFYIYCMITTNMNEFCLLTFGVLGIQSGSPSRQVIHKVHAPYILLLRDHYIRQ